MPKITKEQELQNFIGHITKFRLYPLSTVNSKLSKQYNLSEEHVVAMVMIIKQEDPFVSTIADSLFINISKASRIVRDLEKSELIKRKYGECKDRRKVKLESTEKGLEVLNLIFKDMMAFFKELLSEFGDEDTSAFTKLFEKFNLIADKKIKKILGKDGQNDVIKLKDECDSEK